MHRTDGIHFALMLAAFGLSYLVPFELVLLSYVVLGPAHYLTEISWLHDRSYFLPQRGIAVGLIVIACAASFLESAFWFGVIVWTAFVVCALLAGARTALQGMVLVMAALVATAFLYSRGPGFAIVGVLLPTLVHVSLFTLVFMLLGAMRSRSPAQFALVAAYVAAIVLIMAMPPSARPRYPRSPSSRMNSFGNVPQALGRALGMPDLKLDARITGLLSFVYTYHYLNWFIKAEVIRWADVPKARLVAVAALSVAATAFYFYDYVLGFALLLGLSLTHVLLEFPLNSVSLRQLGAVAADSMTHARGGGRDPVTRAENRSSPFPRSPHRRSRGGRRAPALPRCASPADRRRDGARAR